MIGGGTIMGVEMIRYNKGQGLEQSGWGEEAGQIKNSHFSFLS